MSNPAIVKKGEHTVYEAVLPIERGHQDPIIATVRVVPAHRPDWTEFVIVANGESMTVNREFLQVIHAATQAALLHEAK